MSNEFATAQLPPPPPRPSGNSAVRWVFISVFAFFGFIFCGGILAGLLLPAVSSAREAARRMQCSNNMKQIQLALHNYHDRYDAFPPAYTVDANGSKLHSWRTLILPYLEQEALYNSIDLTKPWDDPANAQFLNMDLYVYRCPSHPDLAAGMTTYLAPFGPDTVFSGEVPTPISAISKGTSRTISLIEVDRNMAVHWIEPTDISPAQITQMIAKTSRNTSPHVGGRNAAFADGSVTFLSNNEDPQYLLDSFSINEGNNP